MKVSVVKMFVWNRLIVKMGCAAIAAGTELLGLLRTQPFTWFPAKENPTHLRIHMQMSALYGQSFTEILNINAPVQP